MGYHKVTDKIYNTMEKPNAYSFNLHQRSSVIAKPVIFSFSVRYFFFLFYFFIYFFFLLLIFLILVLIFSEF